MTADQLRADSSVRCPDPDRGLFNFLHLEKNRLILIGMGTDNSTTLPPLPESQTLPFVLEIIARHFSNRDPQFMTAVFSAVSTLFDGKYPGYHHSDTAYHNFTHTSQATEAVARIADGHIRSGQTPHLTVRDLELAIAAILLHDIGYLKEAGDEGAPGPNIHSAMSNAAWSSPSDSCQNLGSVLMNAGCWAWRSIAPE